jgi:hypothetical protein
MQPREYGYLHWIFLSASDAGINEPALGSLAAIYDSAGPRLAVPYGVEQHVITVLNAAGAEGWVVELGLLFTHFTYSSHHERPPSWMVQLAVETVGSNLRPSSSREWPMYRPIS